MRRGLLYQNKTTYPPGKGIRCANRAAHAQNYSADRHNRLGIYGRSAADVKDCALLAI